MTLPWFEQVALKALGLICPAEPACNTTKQHNNNQGLACVSERASGTEAPGHLQWAASRHVVVAAVRKDAAALSGRFSSWMREVAWIFCDLTNEAMHNERI